MIRSLLCCFTFLAIAPTALAGGISIGNESGIQVFTLRQETTVVKFAPAAGANAYSIRIDDIEYLRQPESLDKLPGVGFGNPVLYPTPNRVKNASFEFDGQTVRFQPNAGKNFIHGLVNRHTWQFVRSGSDAGSASVTCVADFRDGTELHAQFPFPHQLFLTVTVTEGAVRWTYTVDNSEGKTAVPFGFALHPYFVYQGRRENTYLKIPASHWMESENQLPSGRLIPKDDLDYPLGESMSLKGTTFDDVFWGLTPDQPTIIESRDVNRTITIKASEAFTHLVVWTPDRPYFGIESQTCSTDAHNLHAAGKMTEAHLQVCPPGERLSGWVEYRFGD
ncbi:aldose 1-epimerase [Stieleria mannarensis]|uniref:aldose 1-epimerase n=1 Tax=Stieleria mannarensis TaxID=2755585 RepID=UPI0015FEE24F|nr:aldose 1-epimerase [Rhodopirellula sp. JC639]